MLWFLAFTAGALSAFAVISYGMLGLILPAAVLVWASLRARRLVKYGGAAFGAGILVVSLYSFAALRCASANQTAHETCTAPDLTLTMGIGATLAIIGILASIAGRQPHRSKVTVS